MPRMSSVLPRKCARDTPLNGGYDAEWRALARGLPHAGWMKRIFLLFCLLSGCSHAPATSSNAEQDTAIAQLSRSEADGQLAQTASELKDLDEKINTVGARRDNLQMQAGTDVNKQNAVDGAEAELGALQAKRAALLHRQHVLEGRLRELGAGEEN